MSMPIQRQSEAYGIFDDGPRYARDRASTDFPRGLAGLVNTTGPRITGGLLNTRIASCDYCGEPGHDWEIHPEAHRDVAAWEREKHGLEFPFGDHRESSLRESGWEDRPSPDELAREDWETERERNYPRGHGPAWNEDDDYPDADLENLEEVGDPDRFLPGGHVSHRRASRHPFDRAAVRRQAACQECDAQVYPSGGAWYHVDGYPDEYDHDPAPDDDDWANDEYGEGLDPARGMDYFKNLRLQEGRRVALAPAPAETAAMAPQMPVGGGFLPAHRVGLDWRDTTVPGTVIGVDDQVHIRWDDGQYTSEHPNEVRLL